MALELACTSTLGHRHEVRLATSGDLRRSTSEKHESSTGIAYAARVLPEQLERRNPQEARKGKRRRIGRMPNENKRERNAK